MSDAIKALEAARDELQGLLEWAGIEKTPLRKIETDGMREVVQQANAALASLKGGVVDDEAQLRIAREAYFAAGGSETDERRAQKVSRIQIAIREGMNGVLGSPPPADDAGVAREVNRIRSMLGRSIAIFSDATKHSRPQGINDGLCLIVDARKALAALSAKEQTT